MIIAVTGAAGFIGSHLVESLIADGHTVRSLIKPGSDDTFLKTLRTAVIPADITSLTSLTDALKGVDYVYHLAAIPMWEGGLDSAMYTRVNVQGSENVFEAARINMVKKVVFVSSLDAVGPSPDGSPRTEDSEPRPDNIYGESKRKAEERAVHYAAERGCAIVIVRLPMVYGPRNILHLKRYFRAAKSGWYPLIGSGDALMEFCYVGNAVRGLQAAMEKGRPGEIYFISDDHSYRLRDVISEIARQLGCRLRFLPVPAGMAMCAGYLWEKASMVLKFYPFYFRETGRPAFSRRSVRWMSQSILHCDIRKAKRELKFQAPFSMAEGIRSTISWYKAKGLL